MVYIALGELGVLALVVLAFCGLLRAKDRAHSRREDLLLNQMLHIAGRPWQPAPADDYAPPPRPLLDDEGELLLSQHYSRFTLTPEQEP